MRRCDPFKELPQGSYAPTASLCRPRRSCGAIKAFEPSAMFESLFVVAKNLTRQQPAHAAQRLWAGGGRFNYKLFISSDSRFSRRRSLPVLLIRIRENA
ncbi:hypothetical protein EVAR_76363_1 [Eumeta japonica]|uniref:Uncharacterized protein n=1 Tax=Eumeta variegata TaxID=151549 RepID=A0A4C1TB30_EUMVA|nr:hypothetical protein EVAR_76363_1 [Eumeta japonica]